MLLRYLRRRYWAWLADLLTRNGTPTLPRLYEQYGRAALAGAAADPVMSQKITRQVKEMRQKRDKDGRPVRGRAMYAYYTGTAIGAAQLIFSDAGTRTIDADGTHLPTMYLAAACQAAIDQDMLNPRPPAGG
ncbi:hypothetical protein [Nonomuraea sp. NPDC050643]|uniref:hypothetical protein n=1 Tax=Nonomuraea sp. NPDC050643 TaxID=3155660 RepID=UPI0033DA00BE